jgi:hypothetical protein
MKIILVLMFVFLPFAVYGEECSTPEAVKYQWGAVFDTMNGEVSKWSHPTEPQPNESQIDQAIIDCTKEKARQSKLTELNNKLTDRVCEKTVICYDSWSHIIIDYHNWVSVSPAARQPTADKQKAIDHYSPWLASKNTINNYTGLNSITFFNVSSMVAWP